MPLHGSSAVQPRPETVSVSVRAMVVALSVPRPWQPAVAANAASATAPTITRLVLTPRSRIPAPPPAIGLACYRPADRPFGRHGRAHEQLADQRVRNLGAAHGGRGR